MSISVLKKSTVRGFDKVPFFLTPIDAAGNSVTYKIITDTGPLMREIEERWGIWKDAIEGPRTFAANHSQIAANYKLLWLLQKTDVTTVNAVMLEQGYFPVNLLETLAFLRAYPEYVDILEQGPVATDSCVNWGFEAGGCGPGPMSLEIHPSHPSLKEPGKWPTLGNRNMWPNTVILARTSELITMLKLENLDIKHISA